MARSQSSGVLKGIGVGAAVIVGSVTIGYLFGGLRDAHPGVQPAQPPVSTTLTPSPTLAPPAVHPRTTNGNYTAPGAPYITIEEESQPIIRRVTPPVTTPAADPEATQEAASVTPKPAASESKTTDTTRTPAGDAGTPTPGTPDNATNGIPSPTTPTPVSPPPAPADPDFEHMNTPPSGASNPDGGQQGGKTPSDHAQDNRTQTDATKVQFRVQTGAYTDESNARSIADSLRSQGFSASTRSERDGDRLVYKVQVGAYRSKNGADKAAGDLQKKGYPAFISPIGP